MARQIWVSRMVDGEHKLIPLDELEHEPRVYIQQDTMNPLWHPANGKTYDSKSEFKKVTKAHGLIEYGNEMPKPKVKSAPGGIKQDLLKAFERYGR